MHACIYVSMYVYMCAWAGVGVQGAARLWGSSTSATTNDGRVMRNERAYDLLADCLPASMAESTVSVPVSGRCVADRWDRVITVRMAGWQAPRRAYP